jgi:hypothetical protein
MDIYMLQAIPSMYLPSQWAEVLCADCVPGELNTRNAVQVVFDGRAAPVTMCLGGLDKEDVEQKEDMGDCEVRTRGLSERNIVIPNGVRSPLRQVTTLLISALLFTTIELL